MGLSMSTSRSEDELWKISIILCNQFGDMNPGLAMSGEICVERRRSVGAGVGNDGGSAAATLCLFERLGGDVFVDNGDCSVAVETAAFRFRDVGSDRSGPVGCAG